MKIQALGRSLNSSILSSTSFQLDDIFWGLASTIKLKASKNNLTLGLTPEPLQQKNSIKMWII